MCAWVRHADIDDGVKVGVTTDVQTRMRELEQQNRELERANEILKYAASSFGAESGRQHTNEWLSANAPKMTSLLADVSGSSSSAARCRRPHQRATQQTAGERQPVRYETRRSCQQ